MAFDILDNPESFIHALELSVQEIILGGCRVIFQTARIFHPMFYSCPAGAFEPWVMITIDFERNAK
jgi:hypothetical protein